MDLEGNTFWEFRDRLNASRPRRTVAFRDKSLDWVDYASAVSPAWHQWLRALRIPAPTIDEQLADNARLEVLKRNATLADARWAARPSLLNAGPVLESHTTSSNDSGRQRRQDAGHGEVGADLGGWRAGVPRLAGQDAGRRAHAIRDHDPWTAAEQGRAKGFKPGEWDPNANLPKTGIRGGEDR